MIDFSKINPPIEKIFHFVAGSPSEKNKLLHFFSHSLTDPAHFNMNKDDSDVYWGDSSSTEDEDLPQRDPEQEQEVEVAGGDRPVGDGATDAVTRNTTRLGARFDVLKKKNRPASPSPDHRRSDWDDVLPWTQELK